MKTTLRPIVAAALLLSTLVVLHAAPARLAQAAENDKAAGQADDKETFRERTIYIPYEKLRKVFEARGRGVFLPYEEFQELWKAAREKRKPDEEPVSPVGALISEIETDGTVSTDVMQFKSTLKIELLRKGWHKIPLRLGNAAITRATIDGKPARLIPDGRHGHLLLIERGDEAVPPVELRLEFAKSISRVPGRNEVSLQVPQAPVSRWRITIPEPGVKVDIQPLLAASEVPEAETADESKADEEEGKTVVLAFVGAAPTVSIAWTPKTEGATGLTALATVRTQQQVRIREGVMRTQAQLDYTISRAKLSKLAVVVPADQKVINVFDANVRQWSVAAKDGRQQIDVELFEPAEGNQRLTVELEKFSEQKQRGTVSVPVIDAMNVGRQQGIVVVQVAKTLRAETSERTGLLQVDASELPRALAGTKWDFAYRYATVPFELKLAVEKVKPRVTVDSLTDVVLTPYRLSLRVSAIYNVERTGIFQMQFDIPEGFEVHEVRGAKIGGAAAAEVDTHYLTGEKKNRLVVNLARQARGRTGLYVRVVKDLQCPELVNPPNRPAVLDVPIPRVVGESIEEDRGRLIVRSPESLRVNPGKQKGLRAISFAEAFRGMEPAGRSDDKKLRRMFAFAFARDTVDLTLSAERRKPQVTVGQLLTMKIEDDTVHYEAVFTCNVLYSGVKSLRIDVPESIAEVLRNRTPAIRERVLDPQPEDVAKGYQAWSFSGETELLGERKIKLVWEEKLEKLGLGERVPLGVPRLVPAMADDAPIDRTWGQIVLVKAETIDVRPSDATEGLRGIDPEHDLMGGAKVPGAASAFEFHGPWTLDVTATRYELQEVKHTSIEKAVVRMVVTRGGAVAVQALYRVRSARQRIEIELPPSVVFDSEPLRINGRAVTLERGGGDRFFIPLTESSVDRPLVLDLRYTLPGEGAKGQPSTGDDAEPIKRGSAAAEGAGTVLSLPEFPDDPAVQKVYLSVYLPEERALVGVEGPWTNETRWQCDHTLKCWKPVHSQSDAALVGSLTEGVSMTSNPTEGFETDGNRYVFSTLRPTGPLQLIDVSERSLTVAVLVLLIIGGLLLAATSFKTRVLAVGALIAVLVLCGMFAPLLARQVLDGYFLAAFSLVAVVWLVACAMRHRPACKTASASPAPAPEASPPVEVQPEVVADAPAEDASAAEKDSEKPADEATDESSNEGGKSNE